MSGRCLIPRGLGWLDFVVLLGFYGTYGFASFVGGGSRFLCGLLALPLCGAAVTFFAAAKKVTKESSSFRPAVTRTLGSSLVHGGTRLKSALEGLTGLGSRTV
ncbi:hypothetical protein AWB76_03510 [Caballeronia temeraria]|uniref:Transmembrane protein n=1 Tax=Caballeronia temeraria TaxID=1777137 RepID=A0A158B3E5_9BURK|nr:hypothetical protein AWB76_03510 [Caballeronia temeraria]